MPRINKVDDFFESPDIVNGYPLPPMFSIVVPVFEDRSNIVMNPSFEVDTTNWSTTGAPTISVSYNQQFVGARSLEVICTAATKIIYGATTPLSLTSGETYAASMRFLCPTGNVPFKFYVATSADVEISGGVSFRSTGFWQYIFFMYKESSTTSRHLIIATDGPSANNKTFYIDAVQFELTSAGKRYPTTYIDGDQVDSYGLLIPIPYYWNGTSHNSTSTRSRYTRSGGRLVNFRDLGFTVNAVNGINFQRTQVVTLPFGQIDGEQYLRSRKESHTFSITGRVIGRSAVQFDQLLSSFIRELERDSFALDQPITMKIQPMDELENPTSPELSLSVVYTDGVEGKKDNLSGEIITLTFKQLSPVSMIGHSEGKPLSVGTPVTANGVIKRLSSGVWSALSTGLSGGASPTGNDFAKHQDGTVYVGGNFTDAGGSGADYAAKYNLITDTFSVVKSATAFNDIVYAVIVGADGTVYFGGAFTNVDGIANADGIVSYNPTTNTFAALGTGVAAGGTVQSLAFDALNGNLYAGGTFTGMGGVANTSRIAKWNGSVWSALGTGGADGSVRDILVVGTSTVWAVGTFTAMGGVANTARVAYFDAAWHSVGGTGADNTTTSLALGPDGYIYIGGAFDTIGGIGLNKLAKWNGVTMQAVGSSSAFVSGVGPQINRLAFTPDGILYIGGAQFSTINGIPVIDNIIKFDGSNFTIIASNLPGTASVLGLNVDANGTLYIGIDTTGSATCESVTTINHHGTARAYPTFVFIGSASIVPIYYIANLTTNQYIFINRSILPGEKIIIKTGPDSYMLSSFNGNISSSILAGSNESEFSLVRGNNDIAALAAASGEQIPEFYVYWNQAFTSAIDAVGVI